jgi:hypothetical protein
MAKREVCFDDGRQTFTVARTQYIDGESISIRVNQSAVYLSDEGLRKLRAAIDEVLGERTLPVLPSDVEADARVGEFLKEVRDAKSK